MDYTGSLYPRACAVSSAGAAMLGWMVGEKGIEPHVQVWDKLERADGASLFDCRDCELKMKCCPNVATPKIERSPFESARDVARGTGT